VRIRQRRGDKKRNTGRSNVLLARSEDSRKQRSCIARSIKLKEESGGSIPQLNGNEKGIGAAKLIAVEQTRRDSGECSRRADENSQRDD